METHSPSSVPTIRPIILLTHEFAPFRGGAGTYVQEIAAAATRCGIDVEVWAPDRGTRPDDGDWTFPVVRLRCSGKLGLRTGGFAWALARRRKELTGRSVVLLSVGAHMAWAALPVRASNVVAFFHGSEVFKFERSWMWSALMRRLYGRVSRYGAATHFVEGLVRASALTKASIPLVLAPCAVPVGLHRCAQTAVDEEHTGLRLLTVGRLHPRKGQLETVGALALLPPATREKIVYRLAGRGNESYQRLVEDACRAAGVRCDFLGALTEEQLGAAYRRCDIYVQSSRTLARSVEGFGISYLEAAAFGRPSVGVKTGGVNEAVEDGLTGLLAPEGDLQGLAERIERLANDDALRRKMGEAGREHAAGFNWEASARTLLAGL